MRWALLLLGGAIGVLLMLNLWLGYEAAFEIGHGTLTFLAAMIALIFLWLWIERATPLALGLAFSWAGAATILGWWWSFRLLERPAHMVDGEILFVFLATYFTGAGLHFTVVQKSFGLRARALALPVAGAMMASALIHILV